MSAFSPHSCSTTMVEPVRKRTVAFTVTSKAGVDKCSGTTDAGGIARCKIRSRVVGNPIVSMVFSGDA